MSNAMNIPKVWLNRFVKISFDDPVRIASCPVVSVVGRVIEANQDALKVDGFFVPQKPPSGKKPIRFLSKNIRVPLTEPSEMTVQTIEETVPLPDHPNTVFDEALFLYLLRQSISLDKEEKEKIMKQIPDLEQYQIDELILIFVDEQLKWNQLRKKHFSHINKMEKDAGQVWKALQKEQVSQTQLDLEGVNRADQDCRNRIQDLNQRFARVILPQTRCRGQAGPRLFPALIYNRLREQVVGQDEALKAFSVMVFDHGVRAWLSEKECRPQPSLMLLIGPSGVGKTLIARLAAEQMGTPMVHLNGPSLVQRGIVGENIGDGLNRLACQCDQDMEQAQRGIVFIDEFDKLVSRRAAANAHSANYYGDTIQDELLLALEGHDVRVDVKGQNGYTFNTSRLLFILGGAFDGIEDLVKQRLKNRRKVRIGFEGGSGLSRAPGDPEKLDPYRLITKADVIEYGVATQLVGRIPSLVTLSKLTEADFLEILKREATSPLTLQKQILKVSGDQLEVPEASLGLIAAAAASLQEQSPIGARILYDLVYFLLSELKFAAVNKKGEKITLTEAYVAARIQLFRKESWGCLPQDSEQS